MRPWFAMQIVCLALCWGWRTEAADSTNVAAEALSASALNYLDQVAAGAGSATNLSPLPSTPATPASGSTLVKVDTLDDEHKLGVGDKVSFRIEEDKLFSEKNDATPLYITDSGEVEIPYLGRVPALGKTCLKLASEIKALLEQKYYYHATVLLAVDILNKTRGRIYLSGKVKVPGYVEIPGDEVFTVSKAVMRAGGFSEFADKRHVKITRKKEGAAGDGETITIDVAEVLEKGLAGKDLELKPDDRVFVPSKLINF